VLEKENFGTRCFLQRYFYDKQKIRVLYKIFEYAETS